MTLGAFATMWEWCREYGLPLFVLLFGWLVLHWLSNIAARVDGLSMAVSDLRKHLQEIKDEVSGLGPKAKG